MLTIRRPQNCYIVTPGSGKLLQLARIIAHEAHAGVSCLIAFVFVRTCAFIDHFFRLLPALLPTGTALYSLCGHLQPPARTRAPAAFVAAGAGTHVLLAADVVARRLDLPRENAVLHSPSRQRARARSRTVSGAQQARA